MNTRFMVTLSLVVPMALLSCGTSDNDITDFDFSNTVAFAGEDRSVFVNTYVVLDGSNSKEGQDHSVAYNWLQIDGPNTVDLDQKTGARVSVMLPEIGEYLFELRLSHQEQILSSDLIRLNAIAPNAGAKVQLENVPEGFEKGHNPIRNLLVAFAQLADTTDNLRQSEKTLLKMKNGLKIGEDPISITDIFLSPNDTEFWGSSLLDESVLSYGEEISWMVTPGVYDIRAIDERGVEFTSMYDVRDKDRVWDLVMEEDRVDDPVNIRRAKKLMGEIQMSFKFEGEERVYHYVMFAQVESHTMVDEYIVWGNSLSDQATVSANFDPNFGRYQLKHTNLNATIQYRYVFRINGDRVKGIVEVHRRTSDRGDYDLLYALPLLDSSSLAARKVH